MKKRYIYDKDDLQGGMINDIQSNEDVESYQLAGMYMNHAPQSSRTNMCSNTVPHYTDNNVPTICQASYENSISDSIYSISMNGEIDTFSFVFDFKTQKWYYITCKTINRQQNSFNGRISNNSKTKEKAIPICGDVYFYKALKYEREDKPGKHFISVNYKKNRKESTHVIEQRELSQNKMCLSFGSDIVEPNMEKICSIFYRKEVLRLAKENTEITIPRRPGWYYDEIYGWVFLNRCRYKNLSECDLPPLMCKRSIEKAERSIGEVYRELEPMIEAYLHRKVLLAIRLISPLLLPLEKHGIKIRTIVTAIVETTSEMNVAAAILKTGDFENYDTVSLNSNLKEIDQEIGGARDGVATIIGPQTPSESKRNTKNIYHIRDAAIGANCAVNKARSVISMIERFIPEDLPQDFIISIKCLNQFQRTDVSILRALVLEFDAVYIPFIENYFTLVDELVQNVTESCKAKLTFDIVSEKEGLYVALYTVQKVLIECFDIKLFNDEELERVTNMFKEKSAEIDEPDFTVRDQFVDIAYELISSGKFIIMELKDAHKNYPKDEIVLILDRKKGFLNFPKSALDLISEVLTTVKDGDELAGILKACGTIYCTDNGSRQITTPAGRTAFYSVYLSEFGDNILDLIDTLDTDGFFFDPKEVPSNFVPIVWRNGRCAGIVLDGKGLPNPHINISGLSGMGKNRGAYRTAEGHWRLKSKVIFLDIKGGTTEDSLRDMGCNLRRFQVYNLKEEGFPFDIFNVSAFVGKNAKINYILNIIKAAVELTDMQINEINEYVNKMVFDNTLNFSLSDLYNNIPPEKSTKLRNKLQAFFNQMNAYVPENKNYRYSSFKEFTKDNDKIMILSITQSNLSVLRSIVYPFLQSLFEHQVVESDTCLVIYADEMQKYTGDCPLKLMFSEGRQFNLYVVGITQEYRSTDNETRKYSKNAAMEIFYCPANDSEYKVSNKIGKGYSAEEHHQKGVGYIWAKGYFWSKSDNCHKFCTLRGKNDDDRFIDLKSFPENWYGTEY